MAVGDALAREKVGHAIRDALNAIKRAHRNDPFKVTLGKHENVFEAEQAIFRSLDLCRDRREPEPDACESGLNASFAAYEPEPESNASIVFSM